MVATNRIWLTLLRWSRITSTSTSRARFGRALATVAVLAIAFAALLPPPAVRAQPTPAVEDFDIPNGHFYTQAAPGQNGAGYRVANEAGIPLWDEYRAQGGLAKLGYPTTRRYLWNDRVVQTFQFGTLQWTGGERRSDFVENKEVGRPPSEAKRAEPSPRSAADAERYPWSGWWWPANYQAGGPHLFDVGGPLAKYDRFVEGLGQPNPRTREWEQSELVFAGLQWAGHCNGWAAAALLEPEPTEPRVVNGVEFSVADQKGLLTSYHFANAALWAVGGEDAELSPAEFHKALTTWLGTQRKGMVFTFRLVGEEVWSYPAFKYESVMGPDPLEPDVWHVRTTVWLADNDVPAGFVGGRPWPSAEGKQFEYTLHGDPQKPNGGEWSPKNSGRFGRPYMVWFPDVGRRNVDRQLASPELKYDLVQRIVKGS